MHLAVTRETSGLLARKAFHLLAGIVAPLGAMVVSRGILLWGLGIAVFLALLVEAARFVFPQCNQLFVRLGAPIIRQHERRQIAGSTYVIISTFVAFLVFPRDLAITAVAFLAVGDAIGAVVGVAFATDLRPEKNWQGRLACFGSSLLAGILLGHVLLDINIFVVLAGAATAAIVETLTLPIDDNITIPVSSALAMTLLSIFLQ